VKLVSAMMMSAVVMMTPLVGVCCFLRQIPENGRDVVVVVYDRSLSLTHSRRPTPSVAAESTAQQLCNVAC